MRLVAPTIMLLCAATLSTVAVASEPAPYMERSERSAEVKGLTSLDIDNSRGTVDITPSADGKLHVVATKIVRMTNASDVRRYSAEARVETAVRGGRYVVTAIYPRRLESKLDFWDLFTERGRRNLHLPSIEIRLEIQAPATLAASVHTVSGDVNVRGLSAGATVNTTSGDAELIEIRGPVVVETVSGEITLRDVAAARVHSTSGDIGVEGVTTLTANSTSGDVTVNAARDALEIGTVSGDVVVEEAPRGVRAHSTSGEIVLRSAGAKVDVTTQSGDVRARLRSPLEDARVKSVSGDVTLELVTGLGANLAVHSTSGSIDCEVPATVLAHGRNSLEARLGSGGAPVRTETTSGNVTITSGGK